MTERVDCRLGHRHTAFRANISERQVIWLPSSHFNRQIIQFEF